MNKFLLSTLALAVSVGVYGCNSDNSVGQGPVAKQVKEQATLTGKLDNKPVYIYVDGVNAGSSSEFKLHEKNNVYKASVALEKGTYKIKLGDAGLTCGTTFGPDADTKITFGTATQMSNCAKGEFELRVLLPSTYDFTLNYTFKYLKRYKKG